jgi:hypothetical protein
VQVEGVHRRTVVELLPDDFASDTRPTTGDDDGLSVDVHAPV